MNDIYRIYARGEQYHVVFDFALYYEGARLTTMGHDPLPGIAWKTVYAHK